MNTTGHVIPLLRYVSNLTSTVADLRASSLLSLGVDLSHPARPAPVTLELAVSFPNLPHGKRRRGIRLVFSRCLSQTRSPAAVRWRIAQTTSSLEGKDTLQPYVLPNCHGSGQKLDSWVEGLVDGVAPCLHVHLGTPRYLSGRNSSLCAKMLLHVLILSAKYTLVDHKGKKN